MRTIHLLQQASVTRPLNVLGEAVTILGAGDDSKPFEVHVQEGQRGGGPPPHHHPWDEAFYVLSGEVAVTIAGNRQVVRTGDMVHIPGGTVHAYENLSDTAKLLAVVSDCRGGAVFAAFDESVQQLPDDLPVMLDIAAAHGVTFLDQGGPDQQ